MLRRVWRYQRGNQKPYIEEEQTTQWPNTIYKNLTKNHYCILWYSSWLLFNAKCTIFQLYHGENKLHIDEMTIMMMSALYLSNMLSWISQWNKSAGRHMSLHTETLSWFWANKPLLLLLNAACKVEKQQIPIYSHCFCPSGVLTYDLPHLVVF